jgi:hypothetical protein
VSRAAAAEASVEELLESVRDAVDRDLPFYSAMVRNAVLHIDPVFYRPRYTEFFWHCAATVRGWLPSVLIANAGAEAAGSEKLWKLWQAVDYNGEVEHDLIRHAYDESRHSRLFVKLVGRAFPSALSQQDLSALATSLPDVRKRTKTKTSPSVAEALLIDHLLQMNVGEIRTRVHMQLIGPAIFAFAPGDGRDWVEGTIFGLLADEVRHIAYTASLLEDWAIEGAGAEMASLFEERLSDFSRITVEQTEAAVRAYGQAQFPDLLEI